MEKRCKYLNVNLISDRLPNITFIWRIAMILILYFVTQSIGINSYAAVQQQVTVTGTVADQKEETMIGVSVSVKGTPVRKDNYIWDKYEFLINPI